MSTGCSFPGDKAADSLPPSSDEVKNVWSYTSPPPSRRGVGA